MGISCFVRVLMWCRLVALGVLGVSPRGVAPTGAAHYNLTPFKCQDGSAPRFGGAVVNDDFCDCDDGSDEPGTSACGDTGWFYCVNEGSIPQWLQASRVDDSVCDCCDGSDESPGVCEARCRKEADFIISRVADMLGDEWIGEQRQRVVVSELPQKFAALQSELENVSKALKPLQQDASAITKRLGTIARDIKKEAKKKKKKGNDIEATSLDRTGAAKLTCFASQSAKGKDEIFIVNASCLADGVCSKMCAFLCQDTRKFNGTCILEESEAESSSAALDSITTFSKSRTHFSFDANEIKMRMYMAEMQGEDPEAVMWKKELDIVRYMLPKDGDSDLDVKYLQAKQQYAQLVKEKASLEMRHEELKDAAPRLKKLIKSGQLGRRGEYADLFDVASTPHRLSLWGPPQSKINGALSFMRFVFSSMHLSMS
eukprot:gnl/MRDRNA2_/MRDRNA2_76667_c1_seq1.p1 gnl/MRDRNA2_/MRDRNA2_76667_c1~~gnl/MRDRNA2_/MRDRNA2_76667_c1_seq1.p1  ORF type:complete len:428 (-),score=77.11 gnl/MRDRNA2_/MRDRNA2_76667_c1_seq1:479-1762(-)